MTSVKAVLGPTNTGKTHYAVERMLAHATGMIGLPLRLLAREIYDKVVAEKGAGACALITGEERILPPGARYYICTVEAMPTDMAVDCLVVDEIQLAADADRGYLFTDRLLKARGRSETLLLGAQSMNGVLQTLDICVAADSRERFSQLTYAGPMPVTKLPKRSAIVAFSADEVYAIGELLRRRKGGAAIVMGALSPRTRNAQVDLYQSGEVDYLVATDAIGMGLNLDVDHIAFASAAKFDGRRRRPLTPAEMGQIAGRAGRFRSQGSFGETGDCPVFDEALVRQIENHDFAPIEQLEWRNSDLDYTSLPALMKSLARPSGTAVLRQNPNALDEWILRRMAVEPSLEDQLGNARAVRRLWDICRLPDFRKAGHEGHFAIVQSLYDHLADPDARLSDAAMQNRLSRLAQTGGDIATLQGRLAAIRTWTYAANRDDWLENPALWREKTRDIEDRLSDALHEALTTRFVDRRTTALLAGMRRSEALMAQLSDTGEVSIEGHIVGRLEGLVFMPAPTTGTLEGKAVRNAALEALRPILRQRIAEIAGAPSQAFTLSAAGEILFSNAVIARLQKGSDWLSPGLRLLGAEDLGSDGLSSAYDRLRQWLSEHIANLLPTHARLQAGEGAKTLTGYPRGLAFRLQEAGAAVDLRADDPGQRLDGEQREALKALGVRAGRVAAHIPDAQKPGAQRLIACLRTLYDGRVCQLAPTGAGSFALDGTWLDESLNANGYLRFGNRAVRADLAERLAWEVSRRRREAATPAFALPPELASIVSCPGGEFPALLKGLGLVPAEKDETGETVTLWRYRSRARTRPETANRERANRSKESPARTGPKPRPAGSENAGSSRPPRRASSPSQRAIDPDSPFAALAVLVEPQNAPPRKKKKTRRKPKASGVKQPGASVASAGSAPADATKAPSPAGETFEADRTPPDLGTSDALKGGDASDAPEAN